MADAQRTPIGSVADLLVHLPLGAFLAVQEAVPKLIEAGRQRAEQRTALAKMVGQFAVSHGQRELSKRLDALLASPPAAPLAPSLPSTSDPAAHADLSATDRPDAPDSEVVPLPSGIADYDHLAASQIVARLEQLSEAERGEVEAYELRNRRRRTVLGKLAQLGES